MWVPIALSRDVPAGATRAVVVDRSELVVWRAETGSIQVWEDRCPHRGMRLSFGFVRGDALNCLYHGWEYGAHASCRRIPAHPDLQVPSTIRANAFAATEAGGMIWTRTGPDVAMPTLPAITPLATLAIDAGAEHILGLCNAVPQGDAQIFAAVLDGMAFYIGWHEAGPELTMLHAGLSQPADPAVALAALYRFRAHAERQVAA
jgi:phenylpropionate dioxygenase-like ring-hydroxylating dioxygenase large terminal subunit